MAGASPSLPPTSTPAWRGGTSPNRTRSQQAGRTLASTRTGEYMRGLAAHVADCVRVIGWRLDPHGVTAASAFSASSIEDWERAINQWLAHPSDNRVLIATSILLDGRIIYGPRGSSTSRSSSSRRVTGRRWSGGCSGWHWPQSRPPASGTTSSSRTAASRRGPSTSSTAGCCRSSTSLVTPRSGRTSASHRPSSACGSRPAKGSWGGTRRGYSRRLSSSSAPSGSSTRSTSSTKAVSRTTGSTRNSSIHSPGDICATRSGRSRQCSGR